MVAVVTAGSHGNLNSSPARDILYLIKAMTAGVYCLVAIVATCCYGNYMLLWYLHVAMVTYPLPQQLS